MQAGFVSVLTTQMVTKERIYLTFQNKVNMPVEQGVAPPAISRPPTPTTSTSQGSQKIKEIENDLGEVRTLAMDVIGTRNPSLNL